MVERLVTFSKSDEMLAQEFAEGRGDMSRGVYSGSRGGNPHKIIGDIQNGALAELAAYRVLKNMFPNEMLSEPDFSVYSPKNKSWEHDMVLTFISESDQQVTRCGVHVKSFVKGRAFRNHIPPSFMFQKNDKHLLTAQSMGAECFDLFVPVILMPNGTGSGTLDGARSVYSTCGEGSVAEVLGPFAMQELVGKKGIFKPPKLKKLQRTKTCLYLEDIEKCQIVKGMSP